MQEQDKKDIHQSVLGNNNLVSGSGNVSQIINYLEKEQDPDKIRLEIRNVEHRISVGIREINNLAYKHELYRILTFFLVPVTAMMFIATPMGGVPGLVGIGGVFLIFYHLRPQIKIFDAQIEEKKIELQNLNVYLNLLQKQLDKIADSKN
ncbi:MAG: hypothetical protein H6656_17775 [Ardenticatenaceae bacterium]|nr:hypothetical protein [Ardenticatenaceae bacterium]